MDKLDAAYGMGDDGNVAATGPLPASVGVPAAPLTSQSLVAPTISMPTDGGIGSARLRNASLAKKRDGSEFADDASDAAATSAGDASSDAALDSQQASDSQSDSQAEQPTDASTAPEAGGAGSSSGGGSAGIAVLGGVAVAGLAGIALSGGGGSGTPAPPSNRAPTAGADTASATEGAAVVTGSVAGNDTDPDGDTLTYTLAAPVPGLTLNSNGSYSFDPGNAAYQDLAAGQSRSVVANYSVSDGKGGTATAALTITVTGTNDAPLASADSASAVEDGALVTGSVAANDTDVDRDALTFALTAPVAGLTLSSDGSYTFDPRDAAYQNLRSGQTRSVVANYAVSDGKGGSATSTLTITVTGANDGPVAVADRYTVAEDGTLTIAAAGVLANDTDIDSDPLTAALVTGPANGTLTLNANGSFVYTPNANFNGADSFTYRANDGTANSASVTVSITVTPVNDAPAGVADSYSVAEDGTLTIAAAGVLANDTDVEGSPLTVVLVTAPANGTLTLNANGSFVYTPNANFNGPDSFTYRANDGTADSAPVTVSITVTPVNDAPTAVADSYTVAEDATLTIAAAGVLANDTDIDSDPLTAVLVTGPVNGTLTLNANGSFVYTPNANFNGDDSFTYRANDGTADSAPVTVSITVTAVNDAPTAVADSYTVAEDATLTIAAAGVLVNDTDVEGNPLTAVLVTGPANGTLTLNANGSFVYTPNANFNGPDSFTYRANDGTADSAPVTVSITVTPVNDAPVAVADSYSVAEDATLTIAAAGVLVNDTDIDSDPLTAVLMTGPANGTLTLNANGSFVYTPNANYNGPDSFTYRANDGTADSAPVTVSITVTAVNDAPVAVADSYTVAEDATLTIAAAGVLANDTDIDSDPLTAVLVTGPVNGTLTLNANGSFVYTPNANFNGNDSFTYRANDGTADSAPVTVSITVTAVNDAPTAVADSYTVAEDATLTIAAAGVLVNDTDIEGNPLTAVLVTGPANGTLTLNANGSFVYTPNANFNGPDSFTYRANDGTADSAPVTVSITVTPVNDAPTAVADSYTLDENTSLVVPAVSGLLANDTDVEGNPLTAALVTGPANGTLTLNADGSFTYTPNTDYSGSDSFTYRANDGTADSAATTVILTIISANDPPTAVADSYTVAEDATLTIAAAGVLANDSDPNGNPITAVLVTGPANGTLTLNANGSFVYTPDANYNGPDSFTYRANDGIDDSAPVTVSITVTPVNDAPIAVADSYTVAEDATLTIAAAGVLVNDTDVEGNPLTAVLVTGPANGTLTLNANGSFVYTPNANFNGADSFTYRANDGTTNSAPVTVSITVTPVNDPPVAVADSYTVAEDGTLTIAAAGVLANDTDVDVNPLTAALVTGPANGTLTLNANGSFVYTPNANYNGSDSFTYRANDGTADSAPVTVSITVTPVNDPPVTNNDSGTANEDLALTVSAGSGLLVNDTDIDSGSLTVGTVIGSAANVGTQITLGSGALLTVNANGSYTYNPNGQFEALRPGQTGSDSFTYQASDGTATGNTATVSITIQGANELPIAVDDPFTMTGNTPITFTAAQLLANDTDPDRPASELSIASVGSPVNGTLVDNGNGTYTFTPNTGFEGAASFSYTVTDIDGGTDVGVANITVSGLVWYVDNTYSGANGASDGSYLRPYTSLVQLNGVTGDGSTNDDVDGSGATIFVAGSGGAYTAGITLEANQKLFGDGHEFTVNGIQIGSGVSSNSTIDHSTYGVTLASGNEIRGINFNGTAAGSVGIQDGGASTGALTIAGVSVTGTGKAVDIDQGGTLNVTLAALSSSGSSTEGVHLQGVTGTFTAGAGTIQNSTTQGFLIGAAGGGTAGSGGNAAITYGGSILNAGTAAVEIQDRTGGTVNFTGNITEAAGPGILADGNAGTINFGGQISINSGTSNAVVLTNNSAAMAFTPTGTGFDITTTTGSGFIVDAGGGTVTLSGTGNTVTTTSGRAVEIDGVTIGAGGVNFQSVSVTNGTSTTGIFLRNAGTGGFTISGTGSTAASGGSIASIEGGTDSQIEQGTGIYIENTSNISLSNMSFTGDFANFGIRGVNVTNFTLRDSAMDSGAGDDGGFGNSEAADEGAISFDNLLGTAVFEGNSLSDGYEDVIRVVNTSGTLNMTVRDSTSDAAIIGRNGTATGNDGILVTGSGTSNITLLVDGVDFTGSRGDMIQTDAIGSATQNITIRNNTMHNLHPDIVSGGGGITVGLSAGTGSGPGVTYNIQNNSIRGAEGNAILVSAIGPVGQMSGTILNNTIGNNNGVFNADQAGAGSSNGGDAIAVRVEKDSGAGTLSHAVRIEGNNIGDVNLGSGIFLRSNGAADSSGTARLEATIRNNIIDEFGLNALGGIYGQIGGLGTDDGLLGLNIESNIINLTGADNAFAGVFLDDLAPAAQYYFPGYGGPYDDAGLQAFLTGPEGNTITVTGFAVPVSTLANGTFASGAAFVLPVPLMVAAGYTPAGLGVIASQEDVDALRAAAIARWAAAGASEDQIAAMQAVTVTTADLPGGYLGQLVDGTIRIDSDAGGFGWFVDATPEEDGEFVMLNGSLVATGQGEASGKVDLLSVITHELGHVIGLDDLFGAEAGGELMAGFLAPGARVLPVAQGELDSLSGMPGGLAARLENSGLTIDDLLGDLGRGETASGGSAMADVPVDWGGQVWAGSEMSPAQLLEQYAFADSRVL